MSLQRVFNPDTITEIPRGAAELWYSDDGGISWTQYPMPIGWSLLNYGSRNMVPCDEGRFLSEWWREEGQQRW